MRKPSIYLIKSKQPEDDLYFSRGAMKHFGQRLEDFRVFWNEKFGCWQAECPQRMMPEGTVIGTSITYYEPLSLKRLQIRQ